MLALVQCSACMTHIDSAKIVNALFTHVNVLAAGRTVPSDWKETPLQTPGSILDYSSYKYGRLSEKPLNLRNVLQVDYI